MLATTNPLQLLKCAVALGVAVILALFLYYFNRKRDKKILYSVFFIVSGIPLILYPFILMANMMSLAAPSITPQSFIEGVQFAIGMLFLLVTTLYPIIYISCIIFTIIRYKKEKSAILISLIPSMIILPLVVVLFTY